ncbi:MAG: hypothetical protein ACX939_05580 [Hyphococcus sp.]
MQARKTVIANVIKRAVVALFALAQIMPSGVAFAASDSGFEFVICTADGPKSVIWEDMIGEPSPFNDPDQHDGAGLCHACVASCRAGAGIAPELEPHIENARSEGAGALAVAFARPIIPAVRPPMPSRAPPVMAA